MSGRRISLPGADELFRSTGGEPAPEQTGTVTTLPSAPSPSEIRPQPVDSDSFPGETEPVPDREPPGLVRRRPRTTGERRPTGRERHEEKITVYCSAEELIDLERARLTLRGDYGLAADRGRIVREALAMVLADLEAKGDQSVLVRRLQGR
ncbi:MAG TPA: cobyrinic acid a,c-diamide synthase [Mycobacteriales bacterium]|nr:cobyrinic acid a,c-diamide synthase [Mycobacteriales bacterium]